MGRVRVYVIEWFGDGQPQEPLLAGKGMRIMLRTNLYSTGGFKAGRGFQPRQVSPTASAIPASRDSKPPLVWPRAPLLA